MDRKTIMLGTIKSARRTVLLTVLCTFSTLCLYAHTDSLSSVSHIYRLEFKASSSDVDTTIAENASNLGGLIRYLERLSSDSTVTFSRITITAATSPEGSYEYNTALAQRRVDAICREIAKLETVPDSVIVRESMGVAWDELRRLIADSDEKYRDTILSIIGREEQLVHYYGDLTIDQRVYDLMNLDGGRVWRHLKRKYFPDLRTMYVIDIHHRQYIAFDEPEEVIAKATVGEGHEILKPRRLVEHKPMNLWQQKIYLKSNAVGWGFLAGNGAVELELSRHWSLNIPVYYSDLDFFTREIKFKTLTIQPEVRYWFSDVSNFFAGAHLGIGWFNYALNGEYRIQDCGWDSPAWGGGLSGGYRMDLTRNGRWKVEFTLGVGVYDVRYDKFRNEPDGKIVATVHDTWFGIDQAAVSFIYSIGLNRWTR